jgi:hypothetical protein
MRTSSGGERGQRLGRVGRQVRLRLGRHDDALHRDRRADDLLRPCELREQLLDGLVGRQVLLLHREQVLRVEPAREDGVDPDRLGDRRVGGEGVGRTDERRDDDGAVPADAGGVPLEIEHGGPDGGLTRGRLGGGGGGYVLGHAPILAHRPGAPLTAER